MKRAGITFIMLAMLASTLAITSGCGGPGPVEVWNKFVRDVEYGNKSERWNSWSARMTTILAESSEARGETDAVPRDDTETDFLKDGASIKDYETRGNKTLLKFTVPERAGELITAVLFKENGEWKVDDTGQSYAVGSDGQMPQRTW